MKLPVATTRMRRTITAGIAMTAAILIGFGLPAPAWAAPVASPFIDCGSLTWSIATVTVDPGTITSGRVVLQRGQTYNVTLTGTNSTATSLAAWTAAVTIVGVRLPLLVPTPLIGSIPAGPTSQTLALPIPIAYARTTTILEISIVSGTVTDACAAMPVTIT